LRGGALPLAREVSDWVAANGRPDVLVISGLVDAAELLGLIRRSLGPSAAVVVYQHESQLLYPSPTGTVDQEAALRNWMSWCAADLVAFNSCHHRDGVVDRLPGFLAGLPDRTHLPSIDEVTARFEVLPVGVDVAAVVAAGSVNGPGAGPGGDGCGSGLGGSGHTGGRSGGGGGSGLGNRSGGGRSAGGPVVLWPHRWEPDKDPAAFASALARLDRSGAAFGLILAGEDPPGGSTFARRSRRVVAERFGDRIVADGPFRRSRYLELLGRADVVVSCANQELFGVAVVEAVAAGCVPVLPDGLSYPEVIPARWHDAALYQRGTFGSALGEVVSDLAPRQEATAGLAGAMLRFDWSKVADLYDRTFTGALG
jgi:glycosyltransferase involved in cell wall biosynthesis